MVRTYKRSGIPKAYHVYQTISEKYFYARTPTRVDKYVHVHGNGLVETNLYNNILSCINHIHGFNCVPGYNHIPN